MAKYARVRLHCTRTGFGNRGEVVDNYPLEEALEHERRGVLTILDAKDEPATGAEEGAGDKASASDGNASSSSNRRPGRRPRK